MLVNLCCVICLVKQIINVMYKNKYKIIVEILFVMCIMCYVAIYLAFRAIKSKELRESVRERKDVK